MKQLSFNQLEDLSGGRFLGIGKKYETEGIGGDPCYITESCEFTILWIHAWDCDPIKRRCPGL